MPWHWRWHDIHIRVIINMPTLNVIITCFDQSPQRPNINQNGRTGVEGCLSEQLQVAHHCRLDVMDY